MALVVPGATNDPPFTISDKITCKVSGKKIVESLLSQVGKLCLCLCKEAVSRTQGKVIWNTCENQGKEKTFYIS